MSIKVSLDDLAGEIATRGAGYLLSAGGAGRPHVMHLHFAVTGTELRAEVGRSAARNIAAQPEVTLLWPQTEAGGYSLIVDATAVVDGEPDGDRAPVVTATATGAVLHRPA